MNICLNIGCDVWKLPGFINIDINPLVNPDLNIDLLGLENHFGKDSVDFIYAGHIFEHFEKEKSQELMRQCFSVLKPFRGMLSVVPDWRKATLENDDYAERIILAQGDHRMLMTSNRLIEMSKKAGFILNQEISNLREVPYLLVSNVFTGEVDLWQSSIISFKF